MRNLIAIILLLANIGNATAQWSDTINKFTDSLHMPVSTAPLIQKNPIVLNSYPDEGYFVIWEDERNTATTKTDIYAQKFDKDGNRLWALNGVPVVNGPNVQRYTFSSLQDYRSRSFVATDSAGGFYITYSDDSISSYVYSRMAVQHMRSNGNPVWPGAGYILATTTSTDFSTYSIPLLIPDGNKGFFISYSRNTPGQNSIYVFNYRDENGTLKYFGGGRVNDNAIQRNQLSLCGVQYYLDYPAISIIDYNIWYDGQGGCNVVMCMTGNGAGQGRMLGFNRLWRCKKNSKVKTFVRNGSGNACANYTDYKEGEVYLQYVLRQYSNTTVCAVGGGGPVYAVRNDFLTSNGYQLIDQGGYDYHYAKGVTVSVSTFLNMDLIAVTRRSISNNTISDFTVQGYNYRAEIYDSVPYQRSSSTNPDIGYNIIPSKPGRINFFRDTLFAAGNNFPDFSMNAQGNEVYLATLMSTTGARLVKLQHLAVDSIASDSFALRYKTNSNNIPNKLGEAIGQELNTGFGSSTITYDLPFVSMSKNRTSVLYINEYARGARVSPIDFGRQLTWGAMGRLIGSGIYNNNYYYPEQPVITLVPNGKNGIIAWSDNKNLPGIATSVNISMRHLNELDKFNYEPPVNKVRLLNPNAASVANPVILLGSSKNFSLIEMLNNTTTSPVAQITDNHNMGRVQLSVYQHGTSLRQYSGIPYLNRNFTIKTDNPVPTGLPVWDNTSLRLYFTKEEFDALKAADNSITDPGVLAVIRQPNNTTNTPNVYTPLAGEELISVNDWDSVNGGYYIQIPIKAFGNFFIQKTGTINLCSGGSTTLTSNETGGTYQWVVDAGSGFQVVSNGANYSGANTATLQLINLPSAWYGYKYKCIVDGTKASNTTALRFITTWTGTVSNQWNNPANWGCGTVPDANTDVVLNAGAPITVNANAECRSLKINTGASVTVAAGVTLDVKN